MWHWINLLMKKVSAGKVKVIVLASPLKLRAPTSLLRALSHQLKYFSFLTQFLKLIFPLMFVTGVEFTFVWCIFSFPKQPWKLFSLNCWHFTAHWLGVLWLKVDFGVVCKDFESSGITASTSKEDLCADTASVQEFLLLSKMLILCREWLLSPKKMWEIPCAAGGEPHTPIPTGIPLRQVGKYSLFVQGTEMPKLINAVAKLGHLGFFFILNLQADLQPQLNHWASVRNPFLSSSVRPQEVHLFILEIVWTPWLWSCY